jgi:hypothetical protein
MAWTTRMKKYQMPHAKAMAKIHVDISWSAAASTALAAAKGASRGQTVIRGQDLSLLGVTALFRFCDKNSARSAFEKKIT